MSKVLKTTAVAGLLAAALTAFPQQMLYAGGRNIKDQGITVKSWGSGAVSETDEAAYVGSTSVRISGRNFFQGGILVFEKPVDLADKFSDKNNLFDLAYRIADQGMTLGGRTGGKVSPGGMAPGGLGPGGAVGGRATSATRTGGAMGGPMGGGIAGPPAGFGGMMMPGMGMKGGQGAEPKLKKMRVIVTTTDGLKSEAYVDLNNRLADQRGWSKVGVPLQAISGFERTNKEVKSIAFAGDTTATFFVGEVRVVNDPTPIYGEPNVRELNLALGDEMTFSANGYAGSSVLKYEWNFDSKSGDQVDAEGQVVKRRFRVPGDFVVKLTISDAFGLKAPYSTTISVRVNP